MSQWVEVRHLHLVEGVPKAAGHRPADAAGAGVAAAAQHPNAVAGADQARAAARAAGMPAANPGVFGGEAGLT